MDKLKILLCVCAAAVLLTAVPAMALVNIPPPTGGDSGMTGDATASSEEELDDWLDQHTYAGGTLRLTGDITVTGYVSAYWVSKHERIIDCGEYVINVTGVLGFTTPNLTIKGQGSENGMIRAQEGGRVYLASVAIEADSGYALWQEEGAALEIEGDCAVEPPAVHFADLTVVERVYLTGNLVGVVPKGEAYQSVLPKEAMVLVNKGGVSTETTLPIVWDIESVLETLEERIRTNVTGSFDGVPSLEKLVYTVVFHDRDVVFDSVEAIDNTSDIFIILNYLIPVRKLELSLEYSFDEEIWFFAPPAIETDGQTMLTLIPEENGMSDDPYGDEILWPASRPPVSFCFNWQENGKLYYSDIIRLSDGEFSVGHDVGGNRGGGTDLDSDRPGEGSGGLPDNGSGEGSGGLPDNGSGDGSGGLPDTGSGEGSVGLPDTGLGDGSGDVSGDGSVTQRRPALKPRSDAILAQERLTDVPPASDQPVAAQQEIPTGAAETQMPAYGEDGAGVLNTDQTEAGVPTETEEIAKNGTAVIPQPARKGGISPEGVPVTTVTDAETPRPVARTAQAAAGVAVTAAIPLGFVLYRSDWFTRAAGRLLSRFRSMKW